VTTLSNGMRVATETTPGESVAVGVFIKSGSRYETDESNGSVCACVGGSGVGVCGCDLMFVVATLISGCSASERQ
jgi:hypothetical protein